MTQYLQFDFLCFTESGVKSGEVILLRRPRDSQEISAGSLLEAFGNLNEVFEEDGPGKYVARLGLSFSSTVESVNVSLC